MVVDNPSISDALWPCGKTGGGVPIDSHNSFSKPIEFRLVFQEQAERLQHEADIRVHQVRMEAAEQILERQAGGKETQPGCRHMGAEVVKSQCS